MKRFRLAIGLANKNEMHVYMSKEKKDETLSQFYDICSGEYDDNCLEIISEEESIMIKADQIMYINTKEFEDE